MGLGSILLTLLFDINIGKQNLNLFSFLYGFSVGYFIFFLSLCIVTSDLEDSVHFIKQSFKNIIFFVINNPFLALRRLFTCLIEEMFWRVILINLLSKNITKSDIIAAIIVSICFTIDHFPNKREKINFREWFDLFIFSLILGICYIVTKDIIFITLVHFLRNINIDMYLFRSFDLKKDNKSENRSYASGKKIFILL